MPTVTEDDHKRWEYVTNGLATSKAEKEQWLCKIGSFCVALILAGVLGHILGRTWIPIWIGAVLIVGAAVAVFLAASKVCAAKFAGHDDEVPIKTESRPVGAPTPASRESTAPVARPPVPRPPIATPPIPNPPTMSSRSMFVANPPLEISVQGDSFAPTPDPASPVPAQSSTPELPTSATERGSEPEAAPKPAPAAAPKAEGSATIGSRPARLDAPRDGGADDLTLIKGVGPKLAELCHSLGFYHFSQIAGWTEDEVAWVDENLEGFKGRVSRDDWVAQAKILAAGGQTEFSQRQSG